jgi:hypothetical protein
MEIAELIPVENIRQSLQQERALHGTKVPQGLEEKAEQVRGSFFTLA